MKFIHAADLHLDSPFEGLRQLPEPVWQLIYQAPFKATQQLVDQAIDQEVAFVLLAGDLFDRETQSVAAQLFLNEQLQRLIDAQIGVYLCFGNHDYQTANQAIDLPEGVHVFVSTVSTMTLRPGIKNGLQSAALVTQPAGWKRTWQPSSRYVGMLIIILACCTAH
ncbi:metallophosphoesterase family protein [Secundilactobacillus paracollinoides]|uniref:metallophosphoesterase family protein n=1 Tax=Secundilactobacillus paracollinoides TaxID=240427 RepID=UPI0006CFED87|nr:DNA repair exonuclease [Secundilactobacillus paracollinoides]